MFVLVLAVPALLVVVAGYVVGYALWSLITPTGAEAAGWITGLLLLAAVIVLVLAGRRRRGRRR